MATIDFLSKLAFTEAKTQLRGAQGAQPTDLVLSDDKIADAEFYVEQGFRHLTEGSSWDPYINARATAEDAVVLYAKIRLMGMNPSNSLEFRNAVKAWHVAAAKTGNETGDNGTVVPVTFKNRQKRPFRIRGKRSRYYH